MDLCARCLRNSVASRSVVEARVSLLRLWPRWSCRPLRPGLGCEPPSRRKLLVLAQASSGER